MSDAQAVPRRRHADPCRRCAGVRCTLQGREDRKVHQVPAEGRIQRRPVQGCEGQVREVRDAWREADLMA